MTKMRPAITLLITLSVIATMIALMGVMFKYLDVARGKAEIKASIIQADLLKTDLSKILRKTLGKKPNTSTMLTLFNTPVGFGAASGEFAMSISCAPLVNRVNISWLAMDGVAGKEQRYALAQSLFDTLVDEANLRDSSLLQEKILAELKSRAGTTFGVQSRINKKKGIITFKKFRQLLDDYRYETDDKRVYKIDWEKFFTFGHTEMTLDGDFITPELLVILYGIDIQVIKEDFVQGELESFLRDNGESKSEFGWLFSKKALPMASCKVNYSFREGNYKFAFNYMDERIESFEFFGN